MKSNWRNLESKRSNIAWGIICILVSVGMIVASVFYIKNDDSSLVYIFIPLGIIFFVGAVIFFRDAFHQKEIAEEQKQIENSNYEAVKMYGEVLSTTKIDDVVEDSSGNKRIISFEENLQFILKNKIGYNSNLVTLVDEIKNVLVARNDMMKMSDNQICNAIDSKLIDFGIAQEVAKENSSVILELYRLCKDDPFFDVAKSDFMDK